ncbi:MAG: 4-hydroxy-tetrahydrodipicolinate synthase [uncultured Thermomicrobiales bacterium]|uniref:4-hydroxy-tetrahydrodipicolinate synthase n=1 Tax=uncultured Thermomicrobiales bacterium TaxID=1645740 RepID=A0A6J4VDU1_9BACT|nr:MAG: 4-hydroxy-tetrahydrodipicolinate synthase [uncultured Thermomicrobiales bacterium]
MQGLEGIYVIVSTPFDEAGHVDEDSFERLLDATVESGVQGVTILGVAGEAPRLSDAERERLQEMALRTIAGRIPVIVGVSHDGTDVTVARTRAAAEAGAAGVMVAPPAFSKIGPSLVTHFGRIGAEGGLPIVLQDYPPVNGVSMSPGFMAQLCEAVPEIVTIKLEDPPTALRMRQTRALAGDRITFQGGLSGLYFLDELRAGASGAMTGFPYPEVLLDIWEAFRRGEEEEAATIYGRFLPLILLDGQPALGVATRKEILVRRGQIRHATVRQPGANLDEEARRHLHGLLDRLDVVRYK